MEQEAKHTHRRYAKGREYYYDFSYEGEIQASSVLNGGYQVAELDGVLELKGKRLQMLEDELQLVVASQKLARQTAFNRGEKYIEQDRSREKRVTLEARIDVCKLEMDAIKEDIEEAEKQKEIHDEQPCLPRGPEGMNQVRGSTGSGYVDGMWSEHIENVGLVIVDPRSPFRGMKVEAYIEHVAKPWIRASREYYAKRQKEDIAAGKVPQVKYPFPFPSWPAGIRNYLSNTIKPQTIDKPKMVRTR